MNKLILIIAIVFSGMLVQAQSHTYNNNKGTNFINGQFGKFNKSSVEWTITDLGGGVYKLSASYVGSFKAKYSHTKSGMYVYHPYGPASFDNNTVKQVLTEGKLSSYTNGDGNGQFLGIEFKEYFGVGYLLN